MQNGAFGNKTLESRIAVYSPIISTQMDLWELRVQKHNFSAQTNLFVLSSSHHNLTLHNHKICSMSSASVIDDSNHQNYTFPMIFT
jgi:hypothetical protein